MDSTTQKPSRRDFLDADIANFRYENSGIPGEFRLFHCTPEGRLRFALYFGPYQQTDAEPFSLRVVPSNVDGIPNAIRVDAAFHGSHVTHSPPPGLNQEETELARKVCQVLNFHAINGRGRPANPRAGA